MVDAADALAALDEVIPEELRSTRHGRTFLGERYNLIRSYIMDSEAEIDSLYRKRAYNDDSNV